MAIVIDIILSILKFFGIAIPVILGLVLLIFLILLLVPFKYSFIGKKEEEIEVDTKFTWLFSLISVQYILKGDNDDFIVKIPFLSMEDNENITEKHHKNNKNNKNKHSDNSDNNFSENTSSENQLSTINIVRNNYDNCENTVKNNEENNFNENNEDFFFKVWYNKIKDLLFQIKNKLFSVKNKIKSFFDTMKDVISNLIKYKNMADEFDREFGIKRTLVLTLQAVKGIFKSLKPKRFEINGVIGLDDPADTGVLIGIISILTPYLPGNIYIDGDFNKSVLKGDIYIKGRSSLLFILIPVIKYVLKRPILDIIKKYWR